jgi:hypothetical protein
MATAKRKYRVTVGLNYPGKGGEKRAEPGDVVTDLPAKSLKWLVDQGVVEAVAAPDDGDEGEGD